jgi:two-component system, OmpR family, response regulator VicR
MQRILIIEPDKMLARTYAAVLQHAGFTVDVAHGGQAAIQAADAHIPDAVVLELQLAPQDGIAFLHEFRSYAEWWDIPVVIQSTVTPQDLEPAKGALTSEFGVAAFLYKPGTSLKLLVRTVRETLQAKATETA